MNYIVRGMEQLVVRLSDQYPVVLVTGLRQTGKTTMLKKIIEDEKRNRAYVTLDMLEDRELARNDPAMFFQVNKPPILIDEVQYAPELFAYIKILVDKQNNPGDFWMTGSQIFKLMRNVRESLAGRVAVLHLPPLSQREIAGVPTIPFSLDLDTLIEQQKLITPADTEQVFERIWGGGMPAYISGRYTDHDIFYSSYIETYINRDVRELSASIDAMKYLRFITAVSARVGGLLNTKSIADDSDIDESTAKSWLNILETLGVIYYLHPYSNNVLKRTIKAPKLYFYDTGLVCYLLKWSSPETARCGAMNGALLENYAITEIVKSYHNTAKTPFLYYYRDRDTKEIDVLIERDELLHPIEIKKTASPDKRLVKVFDVINKPPLQRGTGAVLCMSEKVGAIDSGNLIVPVWLI